MEDVRTLLRDLQEMSPLEQETHLHNKMNDVMDQAREEARLEAEAKTEELRQKILEAAGK